MMAMLYRIAFVFNFVFCLLSQSNGNFNLKHGKIADGQGTWQTENLFTGLYQESHYTPESVLPFKTNLTSSNITEKCQNDTVMFLEGLVAKENWALSMLDAAGKPPSGILEGNLMWLGSYDQCLKVSSASNTAGNGSSVQNQPAFHGRYCLTDLKVKSSKKLQKLSIKFEKLSLKIGVCVPDSCTAIDTTLLINGVLFLIPIGLEAVSSKCEYVEPRKLDASAIVVICILTILGILVLVGTSYEVIVNHINRHKDDPLGLYQEEPLYVYGANQGEEDRENLIDNYERFELEQGKKNILPDILVAFSLYSNAKKLLDTKKAKENLNCLHGLRFLSMTWVIWGHTYVYNQNMIDNMALVPEFIKKWAYQALIEGSFSVDSFFFLSGLLVSYLTLTAMKKQGGPKKINWFKFYFHRFWRLTPPYMLVVAFFACLYTYIGSGPLWPHHGSQEICKKVWWSNLLYVNNLVTLDDPCMDWTWFLANDMQFYIISPIFLILIYLYGVRGVLPTILLLFTSIGVTAYLSVKNNFGVGFTEYVKNETQFRNWFDNFYVVPWTRIAPYLVGILIGYAIYKSGRQVKMHWSLVLGGWLIAAVVALSLVYGLIGINDGRVVGTLTSNAFYNSLSRTLWAFSVGWVVFACVTGYGGFVNSLLSWSAFMPLSRLTYMAYLIHPIVIFWFRFTHQKLLHYQESTMTYLYLGNVFTSYSIAFVLSLMIESPMLKLEKILMMKIRKRSSVTQP